MRTALALISSCLWSLAAAGGPAFAQERDSARTEPARADAFGLPRHVALDAVERYNRPSALRASGSLDIPAEQEVSGDVAVLSGPLTIAGRVRGSVVVINGDVYLRPGARVDGDLFVVGGVIEGQRDGRIGGAVAWYPQALAYRQQGELLVVDREGLDEGRHIRRLLRLYQNSTSKISLTTEGPYNRVEGLPIYLGPTLRQRTDWGRVRVEAYGILRTANDLAWDSDNLGHDVRAEVQLGEGGGLALGGRLYDVVSAVEDWQLSDTEVGLASFFLHRDFRDYYGRHGATAYVRLFAGPAVALTLSYADERWNARGVRDPFTLFRDADPWRPNPRTDEGRFRVGHATVTVDTRNDVEDPWVGWLITADVERGESGAARLAETSFGVRPEPSLDPRTAPATPVSYTRVFLDLRRYNRVSPEGQLNLRLVLGGWAGGDPLPLQRRLSLGGAGTLPGYDFRDRAVGEPDMLTCSTPAPIESPAAWPQPVGAPAQCERVALVQVEYRGELRVTIGDSDDVEPAGRGRRRRWPWLGYHRVGQWVVFADAGRGWLVNGRRETGLRFGRAEIPSPKTFRTDVGAGLDFDALGFFVAKSTSDFGEPANFFVRVRHRF